MSSQCWNISRQEQDELALASHRNAAQAYKDGFYDDLVFPFQGNKTDGIFLASSSEAKRTVDEPSVSELEFPAVKVPFSDLSKTGFGFMMISSFHSKEIRPMEFCVLIQLWKNCRS
jgi:hypothetical protein